MRDIGIYIGRFCPFHKGHQAVINHMIKRFSVDDLLVFIGSSNSPIEWRVLFTYEDRRRWIKRLYPEIKLMGLPDYPDNDTVWFHMLDDYINCTFGTEVNPVFFGGAEEDVSFYYQYGRNVEIIDRNNFQCSGTNIRLLLLMEDRKSVV